MNMVDASPQRSYALVTVTAKKGGAFERSGPTGMDSKRSAIRAAESVQAEFDADCDPKRAYVVDECGVAVYAAGAPERRRGLVQPS